MNEIINCPNCKQPISSADTVCQSCGINLAIAAVIAESEMTANFSKTNDIRISPEILVPRLGDYLVERGMLTHNQLGKALQIQQNGNSKGDYKLLGRILIEENLIDQTMLDTAITEQIANLQNALKQSNNKLESRVRERTRELQNALNQITQLSRLKTNFISNISHELRTPLAHMIGYLELLKDKSLGPMTEDQIHAVGVLVKSYNRLHNLIDELLQFSMLSQGEMSLSLSTINAKQLLDKATSHAQSLALDKNVKLLISFENENIRVHADKDKISWVLGELIENGIKFNHSGGKVLVNITTDNGLVNFQVLDNGIGIRKEHINEIFEPFHQLDGSSTRQEGGTGIGLSLVKQIIEAHGSILSVKSVETKGTSFNFSLPQA